MKVICENYNENYSGCQRCIHSKLHDHSKICNYDTDAPSCGCCSIKPLRKEKLKNLNTFNEI